MKIQSRQVTKTTLVVTDDHGGSIEIDDVAAFVRELANRLPLHEVHSVIEAFRNVAVMAGEASRRRQIEEREARDRRMNSPA